MEAKTNNAYPAKEELFCLIFIGQTVLTCLFDFHVESGNEKITSKQNSHGATVQEWTQPDLVSFLKYLVYVRIQNWIQK